MSQKHIIYQDLKIPAPPQVTTVNEARILAGQIIPGLSDAEGYIDSAGNFVFQKRSGEKGL